MRNVWLSLAVMALTVYLIRLTPFLIFRKPIRNRWFRSFLYYVPYVTLSVMTFPAILEVTDNPLQGLAAFLAGIVTAWLSGDLFAVSIVSCVAVFLTGMVL